MTWIKSCTLGLESDCYEIDGNPGAKYLLQWIDGNWQ
jgi:hypothetical protein